MEWSDGMTHNYDLTLALKSKTLCPCGFELITDSVGTRYKAISGSKIPGLLKCGGCGKQLPITLIAIEQGSEPANQIYDVMEIV